jgi:signal transduction histidine kinase
MNVVCLFVGMDAHSFAIAESAARLAFPGAITFSCTSLEEATRRERLSGLEVLLLANPDQDDLAKAVEAIDANGLPRWVTVALGVTTAPEGVALLSREEWNEPGLARVLRGTAAQHFLVRENARLRGDLRSIAHRVIHDLRTPLGAILAAGEVLKEVLAEHEPSNAALATSLFDSVEEMRKLMERVSLLAKASANPVSKTPVAMGEVVLRVLQQLECRILKKAAVLVQPAHWPTVDGVPAWLEIIWSNLLLNALQYGKDAARIELGWSQAGGQYRFWTVTHQATVSAEKLRTLFQPFHLLHQPNAKRGLGLSIVQRLLELQGGNCGYEPLSTEGSIFFFTLPAGTRPDAPSAYPASATAVGGSPSSAATPNAILRGATGA